MKKLISLLLTAAIALCATSCEDPLDIFDEVGDSLEEEDDTLPEEEEDETFDYTGTLSVYVDGVLSFSNNDGIAIIETDVENSSATLIIKDMQFTDSTDSFHVVFKDVPSINTGSTLYMADDMDVMDLGDSLYENFEASDIYIYKSENLTNLSFSIVCDYVTYNVQYTGLTESEDDGEDDTEAEPLDTLSYTRSVNVATEFGETIYSSDSLSVFIERGETNLYNEETHIWSRVDALTTLQLTGIRFAEEMSDLEITFTDIIKSSADDAEDTVYSASSATVVSSLGVSVGVTDVEVIMGLDDYFFMTFKCAYDSTYVVTIYDPFVID